MKILIAGSYGFVMNHLIERLCRERCEVYTIAGKNAKEEVLRLPHHSVYEFEPDDVAVKHIIRSVQPDAVLFMGAQDARYDWESDRTPAQFGSDLNNVLVWSMAYGVKHLVYLSSMRVFGGDAGEGLTEEREPHPEGAEAVTIYNGECLCQRCHNGVTAVTILRLPEVYGPSHFVYEKLNPVARLCLNGAADGNVQWKDARRMVIYVSDAVDAVYKAATKQRPQNIVYHVEGMPSVSDNEIVSYLLRLGQDAGRAAEPEPETEAEVEAEGGCLSLDGSRLTEEFSYAPRIGLDTGLERTWKFVEKNREVLLERYTAGHKEQVHGAKNRWKEDLRAIFDSLKRAGENLALFALAVFLTHTLGSLDLFSRVDFMLLYILISAIALGVGQSVSAVLLATGANLYFAMRETGLGFSTLIAQYPFIFGFLFYLILAIIVSYTILRYKLRLREQQERALELQEEYEMLYEVDETNVEIKQVFEQRLLNYGDSIGKVYSIVSELDVMNPDKVIEASLGVVQKIMKVKDVSLYRAGQDGYYHLACATSQEAMGMKRAFLLDNYPELRKVLRGQDVFVDRTVGSGLPRMAAPIYSANRMIYIFMLWNMDFDQLNAYQKDLFLVLSRIITASLERTYLYEEAGRDRKYYPNTDILRPEAFQEQLRERLGAGRYEDLDYGVIRVDPQGQDAQTLSGKLRQLIREDDRLGRMAEVDSHIYILVHANCADLSFVVNKLQHNGVKGEAVSADELKQ